ncbi:MAG: exopolyphosphatase [Candidatus Nanopelagicales bacterium]
MRVAAIDCGTNSIRLLIAEVEGDRVVDLDRRMEIVRLGEGVDRTGRFSDAALERTFAACDTYARAIQAAGAERVRFVATSASRDVSNREAFVAGVSARLGVAPDVISGDEEARLSFTGAVRGLPAHLAPAPRLVVDIGGGSTEFVLGDEEPEHAVSVDVGCVRMTERHLRSDPPTAEEVALAVRDIDDAVDRAAATVPVSQARSLIGVAGSVTTVAAIALGLTSYDPEALQGSVVSAAQIDEVTESLLAMTRAERAALPVMHPGRVDVIAGGALVLRAILRRTGQGKVVVSEHDILDGIAWALATSRM